ncbi:MAG: hypothetical protein LZF86_70002 [Nitrospira sp.]|nr:MAG: hypothetical protein LZF86_70002 [Nitrospira sp.]
MLASIPFHGKEKVAGTIPDAWQPGTFLATPSRTLLPSP